MVDKMDKVEARKALAAALDAAMASTAKGPCGGCGRAYVCLTGDRKQVNAMSAACKAMGVTFLRKAYGTGGNAIYMGYDNADGKALARSEAVAATLNELGVRCYSDAVGD
jgi:hypothetical protein